MLGTVACRVTFRWRDARHGNQTRSMTLEAVEFIRRFLLHILPLRFVKIRHFGFLANRNRSSGARRDFRVVPSGYRIWVTRLALSQLN